MGTDHQSSSPTLSLFNKKFKLISTQCLSHTCYTSMPANMQESMTMQNKTDMLPSWGTRVILEWHDPWNVGQRYKTGYNQVSPNVLEEISAMAGQERGRSDFRPGKKRQGGPARASWRREKIWKKWKSTQSIQEVGIFTGETVRTLGCPRDFWDRKVDVAPAIWSLNESCRTYGLMNMDLVTKKCADHKAYQ